MCCFACGTKVIRGTVSSAVAVLSRIGLMVDAARCLVSLMSRNGEPKCFAGKKAFPSAEARSETSGTEPDYNSVSEL